MTDPGPITQKVPFAWHAASALEHSFLRAAIELEDQIGERASYAVAAKRDWCELRPHPLVSDAPAIGARG